jgi:putative ABC transport system permease protein
LSLVFEIESLHMAIRSIRERKLRSALTVLGIVIGISAIVSLVSIGEGTNKYIEEQFEQFGANKIIVSQTSFAGFSQPSSFEPLSEDDLDIVKRVRGVDAAIPILFKTMLVEYKDDSRSTSVMGINSKESVEFFSDIQSLDLKSGRFIKSGDRYSAVIGSMVAEEIFEEEVRIRDELVIKDQSFEVVGILKEIGNSEDDTSIMIPLESMRDLLGDEDEITYILASVGDTSQVDAIAELIQDKMDREHGEDVILVLSTTKLAEQITTITNMLSTVLGGIAGIALIVAGIGIVNTMYMSILERTKEIGIIKAIGASSLNIMEIFLIEAAIIGLIGGIIGTMFGYLMSEVLEVALGSYGMPLKTEVTPQLAAFGIGFSILVGAVSGFLPARKAAKLDPIEALR